MSFEQVSGKLHLILNFDVNRTIIAIDPVQNKLVSEVLQSALSGEYEAVWKENGVPSEKLNGKAVNYEEFTKILCEDKQERRKYATRNSFFT